MTHETEDLIELINTHIDKAQSSFTEISDELTCDKLKAEIIKYQEIIKRLRNYEQDDSTVSDTTPVRNS